MRSPLQVHRPDGIAQIPPFVISVTYWRIPDDIPGDHSLPHYAHCHTATQHTHTITGPLVVGGPSYPCVRFLGPSRQSQRLQYLHHACIMRSFLAASCLPMPQKPHQQPHCTMPHYAVSWPYPHNVVISLQSRVQRNLCRVKNVEQRRRGVAGRPHLTAVACLGQQCCCAGNPASVYAWPQD
jgi:hypothetical protein